MAIVNRGPPNGPREPPKRNKGLIAGLIKGNQWLISPDHKAGYFWGVTLGGGWLNSHDFSLTTKDSFNQRIPENFAWTTKTNKQNQEKHPEK